MTAFVARNNNTAIEVDIVPLGAGAGSVRCFDCRGDGNWGKFAPEIVEAECKCVDSRGRAAC